MPSHILEIQTGKHKGRRVKLKDAESIIGRDEAAKIRISSKDVSRHHCSVQVRGEKVFVKDLDSSNGTFVNGRPLIAEVELLAGETLTVGPMTFTLLGNAKPAEHKPNVAVGKKAQVDQRLSDDDIASWLIDDIMEAQNTSDTTIIKGAAAALSPPPIPEPTEPKREFSCVAEEANDIIRRHLEKVAEEGNS